MGFIWSVALTPRLRNLWLTHRRVSSASGNPSLLWGPTPLFIEEFPVGSRKPVVTCPKDPTIKGHSNVLGPRPNMDQHGGNYKVARTGLGKRVLGGFRHENPCCGWTTSACATLKPCLKPECMFGIYVGESNHSTIPLGFLGSLAQIPVLLAFEFSLISGSFGQVSSANWLDVASPTVGPMGVALLGPPPQKKTLKKTWLWLSLWLVLRREAIGAVAGPVPWVPFWFLVGPP